MTCVRADTRRHDHRELRSAVMDEPWWARLFGEDGVPILCGSQSEGEASVEDDDDVDDDDEDEEQGEQPDAQVGRLKEEAKRHRLRAKSYRTSAEQRGAVIAAVAKQLGVKVEDVTVDKVADLLKTGASDADSRVQDLTKDNTKLVGEVDRLQSELATRDIDDAIRDAALQKGFDPKRIRSVLKLINRDEIELEDGNVEGVEAAIDEMAEDYSEWLTKSDDDAEGSTNGEKPTPGEKPPPAKGTGRRQRKAEADVAYLREKYPALRR